MKTIKKRNITLMVLGILLCLCTTVFAESYSTFKPDTLELEDGTISVVDHSVRPGWTLYFHSGSTSFFQSIEGETDETYNNLYNKKAVIGGFTINRAISHVFSIQAEYQKGFFSDNQSNDIYYNSINLAGVVNLTSIWNDPTEFRFVQVYGKLGVGLNQFFPSNQIPNALNESTWKYQGGIFAELNVHKNFAIRTGFTMEKLMDSYYEGNSDKDYNTIRSPKFWVWDIGLAYKFNFKAPYTPQEIQVVEKTESKPLVAEELYGKRNINTSIKLHPALTTGKEQHIKLKINSIKNQDKRIFTFIPPEGVKIYDEESGVYSNKLIKLNLDDLEQINGQYIVEFDVLASEDLEDEIALFNANYTYDFRGVDNGITISSSNIQYADWMFKIQVAAFTETKLSVDEIMTFFNLSEKPNIENVDGIDRYMVNGFKTYSASKNKAKQIMENSYIEEAFVVGYKDGVRVKALMGEFIPPRSR